MIKRIALRIGIGYLVILAATLWAQQGQQVTISQGPKITVYQKLLFYSGTNLAYVCTALSGQGMQTSLNITTATNANPGVFTSTAHGFDLTTNPRVTFATAPTGWSALTVGSWIVVPINANTFSLRGAETGTALDTSGFGAWSGTYAMKTYAPRTNQNVWQIEKFQYDGSNNLVSSLTGYVNGSATNKCDDRTATYTEWK